MIKELGTIQSMPEVMKAIDPDGPLSLNAVSEMARVIFEETGDDVESARELCEIISEGANDWFAGFHCRLKQGGI
ncbi:MAG: hypothetical protein QNK37_07495 [Acidobacteriota bacterium]|nr:hypothetical protein [Acidobacteriota bacterium]